MDSTRLSWLASKDIKKLCLAVQLLPFKIEIKGNPVKDGNLWYLFFIPPDHIKVESKVI